MKSSIPLSLYIIAFLFLLPLLLVLINPSMQLGGVGLLLGMIGMFISPVVLVCIGWYIFLSMRRNRKVQEREEQEKKEEKTSKKKKRPSKKST